MKHKNLWLSKTNEAETWTWEKEDYMLVCFKNKKLVKSTCIFKNNVEISYEKEGKIIHSFYADSETLDFLVTPKDYVSLYKQIEVSGDEIKFVFLKNNMNFETAEKKQIEKCLELTNEFKKLISTKE